MGLIQTINHIKHEGFTEEITSQYTSDELYVVQKILEEFEEHGRSDTLNLLYENDFEVKPVSVNEFLHNDYYMGKVGNDLYPKWKQDLNHVLSPIEGIGEWIIQGSVGAGKTYAAVMAFMYKIYYLLCLKDPQKFCGIGSGTHIVFGLFNVYKYLAQATSYKYLITWLRDMSPFFADQRGDQFRKNPNKPLSDREALALPKQISIAIGADAIHALGQNIYGGLCFSGDSSYEDSEGRKWRFDTTVGKELVVPSIVNGESKLSTAVCKLTGSSPLVELVFESGYTTKCTPKHEFLLDDGVSYCYAQDSVGARLFTDDTVRDVRLVPGHSHDVFCLTTQYGNFKLADGPYVHNCDEAEFGKSKSVSDVDKSQVADLYQNVRNRMDSRFMQRGGVNPGLLCLVSSAGAQGGFLSKHVEAKKSDESTYFSRYALYEVKEGFEDSPRFKVVVGDKLNKSYIVRQEADPIREGARVVDVPVEFKPAFEKDIDDAIRNIAGVETYGSVLYLPQRDKLISCLEMSTPRQHPFSKETLPLSIYDTIEVQDFFEKDRIVKLFDKTHDLYKPLFYPTADRFIHVDLAKNRDCAGMAMTCVSETMEFNRVLENGTRIRARDYKHFLDFAVRFKAPPGGEIDFSKIRTFIFFLRNYCSFPVKWVSFDSYQSTDSLQTFKKEKNIEAKELSLDKKPGPYRTFRNIILELRFDMYEYPPFYDEITTLEDHTMIGGKKIDHPVGGSKDVSDAVCGSVTGSLLYKGHQITGTDAQKALERSKEYLKHLQGPAQSTPDAWIKGSKGAHPLEDLFK